MVIIRLGMKRKENRNKKDREVQITLFDYFCVEHGGLPSLFGTVTTARSTMTGRALTFLPFRWLTGRQVLVNDMKDTDLWIISLINGNWPCIDS